MKEFIFVDATSITFFLGISRFGRFLDTFCESRWYKNGYKQLDASKKPYLYPHCIGHAESCILCSLARLSVLQSTPCGDPPGP